MKPTHTLAETTTTDGARLSLHERDHVFTIRLDGRALMDSSVAASEILLGELAATSSASRVQPRLLIGGLGLGFTLRRALEVAPPDAIVEVAELIPAIVAWNREHLLALNGESLRDPRARVLVEDVWRVITRAPPATYDAIALDIDNGPVAMVQRPNARLYKAPGLARILTALRPGGRVAIWSASRDDTFATRLGRSGLNVSVVPAKTHASARRHSSVIYLGEKSVD